MISILENIHWIDVRPLDEWRGDYLLGNALSAILKFKNKGTGMSSRRDNSIVIGLNLINLTEASPFPRCLDDLTYVVENWPIFAFNFKEAVDDEDEISSIITDLQNSHQILPVIKGISIYDNDEMFRTDDNEWQHLLSGRINSFKTSTDNWDEFRKCHYLPGFSNSYFYDNEKIVDNTQILWLGVNSDIICNLLSELFDNNCEQLTLSQILEKRSFTDAEKNELQSLILHSNLFNFEPESQTVHFKFLRKSIIPQVRARVIMEFIAETERANVIDIIPDEERKDSYFWYYDFNRLLLSLNDIYVVKLGNVMRGLFNASEFDKICIYDTEHDNAFINFIEDNFDNVIRIIKDDRPRLFPFDIINPHERILVITDVVNSGNTLDNILSVLSKAQARVVNVFAFVFNSEKLSKYNTYKFRGEDYSVSFFLKRKLHKTAKIKHYISSKNVVRIDQQIQRSREYAFFWELMHKDGLIYRKHYTNPDGKEVAYACHFDYMFDFSLLGADSDFIMDFLNRFNKMFGGIKFDLILTNTSKFAPNIADIINKYRGNRMAVQKTDFSRGYIDFDVLPYNRILLIDDGINSYESLKSIVDALHKKGMSKEQISTCVMISRNCIGKKSEVSSNRADLANLVSNTFIYYTSNIPFFYEKEEAIVGICPNCRLFYNINTDKHMFGTSPFNKVIDSYYNKICLETSGILKDKVKR